MSPYDLVLDFTRTYLCFTINSTVFFIMCFLVILFTGVFSSLSHTGCKFFKIDSKAIIVSSQTMIFAVCFVICFSLFIAVDKGSIMLTQ